MPGLPDESGAIAGRVWVAEQPGVVSQPLSTLIVRAEAIDSSSRPFQRYEVTDSDGNYRMDWLDPGTYRVHAFDPLGQFATQYYLDADRVDEAVPVTVTPEETTANIDFPLWFTAEPHLGSISGRITAEPASEGAEELPLEGVIIEAFEEGGHELIYVAMTDVNGTYRLEHLMFGRYQIRARDPSGEYIAEWWSDITDSATSRSQARYIYVARGANVTGIDLALQPANP